MNKKQLTTKQIRTAAIERIEDLIGSINIQMGKLHVNIARGMHKATIVQLDLIESLLDELETKINITGPITTAIIQGKEDFCETGNTKTKTS